MLLGLRTQRGQQRPGIAAGAAVVLDAAAAQGNRARSQIQRFVARVSAHQDGAAVVAQARERRAEPFEPWRSRPAAGSSSSNSRGPCSKRARNGQPLAHAAGKCPHQASGARSQAAGFKRFAYARGKVLEAVKLAEKREVFCGGQFVVKQGAVADHADQPLAVRGSGPARIGHSICRGSR